MLYRNGHHLFYHLNKDKIRVARKIVFRRTEILCIKKKMLIINFFTFFHNIFKSFISKGGQSNVLYDLKHKARCFFFSIKI